jgi:DNA-binding protein HU-beta
MLSKSALCQADFFKTTLETEMITTEKIATQLAENMGLTKVDARKITDAIFEQITGHLAIKQDVLISGFGKFKVKQQAARQSRNPQTGAIIQVPAKMKLSFNASEAFGKILNP